MIDINSEDFIKNFDPKQGVVGVIGHGYVGQAVDEYFKGVYTTLVYDKAKHPIEALSHVVASAEVIFVCVPTPMRGDGSCHTGIVESVFEDIKKTAKDLGRDPGSFIIVTKSTVYPGFTEEQQFKHHELRLVFSPEFLTEKSSVQDFKTTNRVVLGGEVEDARVVFKYFEGAQPERVRHGVLSILQCPSTTAEMVKLFTNGILTTKVMFVNEIYQLCSALNIEYEEVRLLACLDPRIGPSHTRVPGHDGHLGYGGSCFPKDINNLKFTAAKLGVKEKLFTAVVERNLDVRPEKDWEQLEGRAVIKDPK